MGTAFETEMGVIPELSQAVQEMDWLLPTDIQAEAVPQILGGRDVLMAAETGSGKTGAFALPILQIVYETLRDMDKPKAVRKGAKTSEEWHMNMFDRGDAMAVDQETNRCQSRDMQNWHGCRATKGVMGKGKYYFEATVTDEGLCRVGWAMGEARLDLGTDKFSFGYGGTGKKSFNKQFDTYGEPYGLNDVIGNYLDLDKGEIKWSKNGKDLGIAFKIPQPLLNGNDAFFPAICLKNAEVELNFGATKFKTPPTGGFVALCSAPKKEVVPSRFSSSAAAVDTSYKPNAPLAIIIEPSRELAEQTLSQIRSLKKYLPKPIPRELLIVGGQAVQEQLRALDSGVDIVVATPGRLEDLISEGKLLLSNCRFFVLDECDGLLAAGYEKFITKLHTQIPKITNDGIKMQMIVCSATLHSFDVTKMAERLMRYPLWIDLKGQDSVPETVHHVVCVVDPLKDTSWKELWQKKNHINTDGIHADDRLSSVKESPEMFSEAVKILKGEYVLRAISNQKIDRALIFCRTKIDCDNLEQYLIQRKKDGSGKPLTCVCLHGDRSPNERKANLEAFKNEKVRFLICTDVAARGIDIRGLPYVINVTLPDEKQNYVHRIGRVGRAERMGLAISLVASVKEKVWYHSNCRDRGRNCYNTQLTDAGGCAIWYNEPQLLADIEEHLGVTIDQVDKQLVIPTNEFDGKVVYGQKMKSAGSGYQGHVDILLPAARDLAHLEKVIQDSYLDLKYSTKFAI